MVRDWVVLVELCRRIKGAAEFFLDLEEEEQSLRNQAELQEGLFSLAER